MLGCSSCHTRLCLRTSLDNRARGSPGPIGTHVARDRRVSSCLAGDPSHLSHLRQRDFFWFFCLRVFGVCVVFVLFSVFLFPVSLCLFACLSSFTDWCTAHSSSASKKNHLALLGLQHPFMTWGNRQGR